MGSIIICNVASRHVPKVKVDLMSESGELLTKTAAIPDSRTQATIISPKILRRLGEDPNNLLWPHLANITGNKGCEAGLIVF